MGTNQAYGVPAGEGEGLGSQQPSTDNLSENPESQSGQQDGRTNENYVTKQELRSEIENAIRKSQSMIDKMGSRVDKELERALSDVQRSIELAEKSGVPLTDEQKQSMKNKAIEQSYDRAYQDKQVSNQNVPGQQGQAAAQQSTNDQFSRKLLQIMEQTGVFISAEEANKAILSDGKVADQFDYLREFEKLARNKANSGQTQGPNPAIPSQVSQGRPGAPKSAVQQNYEKEMQQIIRGTHPTIRRGDTMGIIRLKASYRDQGADTT